MVMMHERETFFASQNIDIQSFVFSHHLFSVHEI